MITAQGFIGDRIPVLREWLDYNGHLNDSAYAVVCSQANETLLAQLGLSAAYQEATGCALYTVESHLRYLAEVGPDDELHTQTLLVDSGPKRIRLHTTVSRRDGTPALTGEYLFLHVDQSSGRVCPLPEDRQLAVDAMTREHAALDRPAHLGRGIR